MEKILICSSDESFREFTKETIGDKFELILCEDIDQCPEILLNAKEIKTFILDIDNQEDVLGKISNLTFVKLIVVASHTLSEKAEETVRLGASGHILKPLKPEAMLSVIK